MDKLNFRVIHVPTEIFSSNEVLEIYTQRYAKTLKHQVESCGLNEATVHVLKVKKSEDEDYPEIEELVFDVQAKTLTVPNYGKHWSYMEFLKKWKIYFAYLPLPIVMLHESESFIYSRYSCHISRRYTGLSFGVLPHNGEFHEFASLRMGGSVDFFHDTRNVKIKCSDIEMSFPYNSIRNIFVNIGSDPREIFFDLCNPPMVFQVEQKQNRYEKYVLNHRVTLNRHVFETVGSDNIASTGRSSIVHLSLADLLSGEKVDVDAFGRSNVIRMSLSDSISAEEIIGRIHTRCGKKPVFYGTFSRQRKVKPSDYRLDLPHFGCVYLLTAIFKRNFTMISQSLDIRTSMNDLKRLCAENADCLEKALTLVLAAVDSGKIVNYWHAVEKQFRYYVANDDEINFGHYVVPEKCRMIRRVTLTPSRTLLWPPDIMFSNRVLRNFDSDYALRVSFRDDNNSRLSFVAAYAKDEIFELSVRRPMTRGIQIGFRSYEFLAWSNSQIRDHGIWMYAQDSQNNTVR